MGRSTIFACPMGSTGWLYAMAMYMLMSYGLPAFSILLGVWMDPFFCQLILF